MHKLVYVLVQCSTIDFNTQNIFKNINDWYILSQSIQKVTFIAGGVYRVTRYCELKLRSMYVDKIFVYIKPGLNCVFAVAEEAVRENLEEKLSMFKNMQYPRLIG